MFSNAVFLFQGVFAKNVTNCTFMNVRFAAQDTQISLLTNCAFSGVVFSDVIVGMAINSTVSLLDAGNIVVHTAAGVRIENAVVSTLTVPEGGIDLLKVIIKSGDLGSIAPFGGVNFSYANGVFTVQRHSNAARSIDLSAHMVVRVPDCKMLDATSCATH